MQITEIQNRKIEITTDVLCDSCGQSCKVYESVVDNEARLDNGEKFYEYEFMNLDVTWGYNSNKDAERWTAQICEKCVDEKFSFIKFKKVNYM